MSKYKKAGVGLAAGFGAACGAAAAGVIGGMTLTGIGGVCLCAGLALEYARECEDAERLERARRRRAMETLRTAEHEVWRADFREELRRL